MAKGFRNIEPGVKETYLEWLLTPPSERNPQTKAAMAQELGVATSTLWQWEKSPEFTERLRQVQREWGVRFYPEILARLMKVIAEGTDTAAIQAAKVLLPHMDNRPKEAKEEDLTEEHLLAIKAALEEQGFEVTG